MKKIKFCAWTVILKKMIYGVMITLDGWVFYEDEIGIEQGIGYDGENCFVMQYIGLKDKNNREIYEGNIVKTTSNDIFKVSWNQLHCCYGLTDKNDSWKEEIIADWCMNSKGEYPKSWITSNFEVIGNVYQNPELLEGL